MVLVSFDLFLLVRMNAFQDAFDGFRAVPSNKLPDAESLFSGDMFCPRQREVAVVALNRALQLAVVALIRSDSFRSARNVSVLTSTTVDVWACLKAFAEVYLYQMVHCTTDPNSILSSSAKYFLFNLYQVVLSCGGIKSEFACSSTCIDERCLCTVGSATSKLTPKNVFPVMSSLSKYY